MKLPACALCLAALLTQQLHAASPQSDKDYQSLQIASSGDVHALKKLYQRYTTLPYLRVEKRGALYVLRAGFWESGAAARQALEGNPIPGSQLRVAMLRPEALVLRNWEDVPPAALASEPTPVPASLPSPAAVVAPSPPARRNTAEPLISTDTLRNFNAEDSALAYDVFLGAGDLQRAFKVAEQAVAKLPRDAGWRRKLARVAEWTQRPNVAAEQWRALFLQGDRSDDTLAAVFRLSDQMDDPTVALQAWQVRAEHASLNAAQWTEILNLYEELAQPTEGSRYFEAQYRKTQDILLLDYAARLATGAGDDDRALALYLLRANAAPFAMDAVLQAVVLLVRKDRLPEALQLMQSHTSQIPADAAEYWRLLGQIAWDLRNDGVAQDAYHRYVQSPGATAADWSRLIFLVRQKYPAQAADLALEAYRRYGTVDDLVLALELYAGQSDMPAQTRIFQSLKGDALAKAQGEVRFLLMRAQYFQRQNAPDLAWNDLRRALQLAPGDKDTVLSSLWFLIDTERTEALAASLKQHASAAKDPAYWLAYAAGNQVLGRHREALRWYNREVRRTPQNALLLLNYADALERVQQPGMAARVRRHAWLQLQQTVKPPDAPPLATASPEMLATARLALLNRPGDPALQQVRQLVRKMRGQPSAQIDEETRTLVLGWAIAQEQFANARSWMWLRYARQAGDAPPLWGQSQVALQLGDTQTMDRLLAQPGGGIPLYNRYDTAYALGHVAQALDMGFQGLAQQGDDEALHDRLRQHVPGQAGYLQLLASQESLGALDRKGLQWEARLVPNPQLHVLLGWSRTQQSSTDPNLQTLTPDTDQLERVQVQWLGPRGQGNLALFQRQELQSYTGLHLDQTLRWGERLSLEAGLDYRADSTLSLPMQIAGYEHAVYGNLDYTLGKREYLRASPRFTQYYSQYGDYLGRGSALELEAGYRIRTEYPDWRVRAVYSQQNLSRDGGLGADTLSRLPADLQNTITSGALDPSSYFIPESSSTWGLCVTMGENLAGQNLQTVYSRAWRPYLDLCMRDNTTTGNGYTTAAGVAGSLTGEDHLSIELRNEDGLATAGAPTRALTIRYRHYF